MPTVKKSNYHSVKNYQTYFLRFWTHVLLNEWMNEWMNESVNEWMNEWMNESVNEWMNEWISEMNESVKWMNEWMNQWMNESVKWMNEWMNEWMSRPTRRERNQSIKMIRAVRVVMTTARSTSEWSARVQERIRKWLRATTCIKLAHSLTHTGLDANSTERQLHFLCLIRNGTFKRQSLLR